MLFVLLFLDVWFVILVFALICFLFCWSVVCFVICFFFYFFTCFGFDFAIIIDRQRYAEQKLDESDYRKSIIL